MPEKQNWLQGLLGNFVNQQKENWARGRERGNPWLKNEEEQAGMAYEAAQQAANEGGVGQGNPALEGISQQANRGLSWDMSRDFDPTNNESVLEMQRALNRAGFTDEYGNALKEDGMMGGRTEWALRKAQADRTPESRHQARGSMGVVGDFTNPERASQNLRGAAPVTDGGYTGDAPVKVMGRMDLLKQKAKKGFDWLQSQPKWPGVAYMGSEEKAPWANPQIQSAGPGGRMESYKKPGGGGRNY